MDAHACVKMHISNDCKNWSGPSNELDPNVEMEDKNLYSPFQCKLLTEMLAREAHDSLDNPPSVAMFSREKSQMPLVGVR